MIEQSLAHPAHPTIDRIERGRVLYRERADEFEYKNGSWFVPSGTVEGRTYAVRLGPVESCECSDHEHRGSSFACKHIAAASIAQAKSRVCSCCGCRVLGRFVTEVREGDELLSWFVGDHLCADCIAAGFWA